MLAIDLTRDLHGHRGVELVDEAGVPPEVVAGSVDGLGAVGGGFTLVGGDAGLVAVWFEQAAQMPSNIAIVAFLIGASLQMDT